MRQNNDVLETDGKGRRIKRVGLHGCKNLESDLWLRGCVGEWEKEDFHVCLIMIYSWNALMKRTNQDWRQCEE